MVEESVPPSSPSPRDYSRLAATAFTRDRLKVTALVVGAGALGNEVLKNLALLGVSDVVIVDRDRVEASNLTRSILYCTPDIGRHLEAQTPKAVFAAERVREINSDVRARPVVAEIADVGFGVIRRSHTVFSCLDNEIARLELSWACSRLGKTLVDGGLGLLNYSSGQVSVFPSSGGGPCYACRKGADRRRAMLQDLVGREDPCWRKEAAILSAEGVPTTPLMASVVGAVQVELAFRHGDADQASDLGQSYQITLHPRPSLESQSFGRSASCPLHDDASIITSVIECPDGHSDSWTAADVLDRAERPDGIVVLDWPISALVKCGICEHQFEPFLRRARLRGLTCPNCQSSDLIEIEVLRGLTRQSRWGHQPLASLGLPLGHVYEVADGADPSARRIHVELTGDLEHRGTAA